MKYLVLAIMLALAVPAFAADEVITFTPSAVTVLKDRNQNEYVRMVWGTEKELDGIKYSSGSTVNAYRELVAEAKKIKPGTQVTCVVSKRNYNGTVYYTVLAFKPTAAAKK